MLVTAGCPAQVCTRPKHLCSVCSYSVFPHWNTVQLQWSVSISVYTRIKAVKGLAIGYKKVLTLSAVDELAWHRCGDTAQDYAWTVLYCVRYQVTAHQWCILASSPGSADRRPCQCHQCRGSRQHGDCDDCIHHTAPASMHIAWALCWDQTMLPLMRTIVQVSCTVQYSTVQQYSTVY